MPRWLKAMGSLGRRSMTSESEAIFAVAVCGSSAPRSATLGDDRGDNVSHAPRLSVSAVTSQTLAIRIPAPLVTALERASLGSAGRARRARRARGGLRLHRQQAFALQLLAG